MTLLVNERVRKEDGNVCFDKKVKKRYGRTKPLFMKNEISVPSGILARRVLKLTREWD